MDLSPDDEDFQGRLLHQAALWDNVELLQSLLSAGADPDARDSAGRSALHAAALHESGACVAALIRSGADVDAKSDHSSGGKTALHIACERGHVGAVTALLEGGADVEAADSKGDTPLLVAARRGARLVLPLLRARQDAIDRSRLSQHAALRALVLASDVDGLRAAIAALRARAGLIVNMTPGGANTLLYLASESGSVPLVQTLVSAGSDARAHAVTRYTPLHAACSAGHQRVAGVLLDYCPQAVKQVSVEQWLPLHAAVIGGHVSLVTLLLQYNYPQDLLDYYTDVTGEWRYQSAFDVNAVDASGQTALYVASALGNLAVVDALLGHTVVAERVHTEHEEPVSPVTSPARSGIALGIHAIVTKLAGHATTAPTPPTIHPVRTDICRNGDSCIGAAARGQHSNVVKRLLQAGADPNAPAAPPNAKPGSGRPRRSRSACPVTSSRGSASPARYSDNEPTGPWTALVWAVHTKNPQLAELLLQHGATDQHNVALRESARLQLAGVLSALVAHKSYVDPEYKLNKAALSEAVFTSRDSDCSLTYSALCPAQPAALSWREMGCQLEYIRMSWLRAAALRVNPKLTSSSAALNAITRIDVANNELRELPHELFTLLSLRYLNAAQNKLERLPSPSDPPEQPVDSKGRKMKQLLHKSRPSLYSAPVLQELYLQDNRLEDLPPALFSLPSLSTLDVSNNKLRHLPAEMWSAAALQELHVQLNHLKELPTLQSASEPAGVPRPQPSLSSASSVSSQSHCNSQSQSSSRSPSIDCSESDGTDDVIVRIGDRDANVVTTPVRRVHTWRGCVEPADPPPPAATHCRLNVLNLAHNQFTCVPPPLACLAPQLQQLNMSYNSLRSMSFVTSYPTSLRQLDISHNEITCWPSLPQLETFASGADPLACYCPASNSRPRPRPVSGTVTGHMRTQLMSAACTARRHLTLEGLRTLILANNLLTRIQLTTDDDGHVTDSTQQQHDGDDWEAESPKSRLLFPLLSMLDVSCNLLRCVPPAIHQLTNLAVLNISGNKEITDLPPQMGLLSRLWNLSTVGCNLSEPLASMLSSGRYRSMDVVGYLKSVLQEAHEYRRLKLMVVGVQGIGKTSLLECLRQESALHHRRKQTDHWAKRMGNKSSRRNMSTVGVDIGQWTYEKARGGRGPVTFRTWDFGGQQEYYATHQYFLSRRSLYLVVWRSSDGARGLAEAVGWLRSIQARAPGAPVIMVATYYDQACSPAVSVSESPEALQRVVRSRLVGAGDADKLGLPRVLDSLDVSCATKHNIRLLADIIYTAAFSVKPPGSKQPLLEQLVPASYLALEEAVTQLAAELPEPVLRHEQYKALVTKYMQQKCNRTFRDSVELQQATMFLHDNGVLLHYEDANLKELYFLRPQWLCDVLSHVVTVREINPFATTGLMKLEDLQHVFKASPLLAREDASALALSLLNKFELALCWDARLLLIPPLLTPHEPTDSTPTLLLRSRSGAGWSTRPYSPSTPSPPVMLASPRAGADTLPLRRLLLLSYVPCGFWARLLTRVLADQQLPAACGQVYTAPTEMDLDASLSTALDLQWGWQLWKTGLKLVCGDVTLLAVRELAASDDVTLLGAVAADGGAKGRGEHGDLRLRMLTDGAWSCIDVCAGACVEICLPAAVCVLRRVDRQPVGRYQSISLEPRWEVLAKLLAILSDHVDLLLEDWYPALGTRFVHTSSGRCLITRAVPCPLCLRENNPSDHLGAGDGANTQYADDTVLQALDRLKLDVERQQHQEHQQRHHQRVSQESRASDGDSGVGHDSNASSRLGSVEGPPHPPLHRVVTAWSVEQCILAGCSGGGQLTPPCNRHPDVRLRDVAPDTMLLDIDSQCLARWDHVSRSGIAGRGAFGTVLRGEWRRPHGVGSRLDPGGSRRDPTGSTTLQVAIKALQPVPPPHKSDVAAMHAYKAALSRWDRDPLSAACRAYCALRQELAVLRRLTHAHVVALHAVCASPLALLLELAPQGALDGLLRSYRVMGARLSVHVCRAVALQVARALEYLHARRVVYRDLKSENVLVWQLPLAGAADADTGPVLVKLGDYGISRLAPPSGTKGFGGTEGFMAPEIMRYNGEEEYNEKVDCFSYGMLVYELLTLRQPFEGHEAVKECVLDGARPALTPRDLEYPCTFLSLMSRCWSALPAARPSGAALVALLTAPECAALHDVVQCSAVSAATAVTAVAVDDETPGFELWLSSECRLQTLQARPHKFTQQHSLRAVHSARITALCTVHGCVWAGDDEARITVYDAATCKVVWDVSVQDAVGGAPSPISCLTLLPGVHRVAVALACGRLFLVTSQRPLHEGSFVCTELGTATELNACVAVRSDNAVELWAGGDTLCAYSVGADGVLAADQMASAGRVTLLAAGQRTVVAYCDPGTLIYQYSVSTKQLAAKLDVSKLAPCSESLHSIALHETQDHRVTSLCCTSSQLVAGTASGVMVVADHALRPLTVFRPYEADCCVGINVYQGTRLDQSSIVVTVGTNYRPLVPRYAPATTNTTNNSTSSSTNTTAGTFCLLWDTRHWNDVL